MLREQTASAAANRGAAAEYARGASKGLDYEEFVSELVAEVAAVPGDRAEQICQRWWSWLPLRRN